MVAKYRKEDVSCAVHSINNMLIEMIGVPKKYIGTKNEYKGHFSKIYKWTKKERYNIQYVYFVIDAIYQRFLKGKIKPKYGYIIRCLEKMTIYYNPEKHKLPYGGDRESMLKAGFTIDFLPYHLLTKKEKKERREYELNQKFKVTEENKRELQELLDKIKEKDNF